MRRIVPKSNGITYLATVCWVICVFVGNGVAKAEDPEMPTPSSAEVVQEIRAALKCDLQSLAALGVSGPDYDTIILLIKEVASAANDEVLTEVSALRSARKKRAKPVAANEANGARRARAASTAKIRQHYSSIEVILDRKLTPEQRRLRQCLLANDQLSVPVAILEGIDKKQRALLLTAQEDRHRVLSHPRNWHRHGTRRVARLRYEMALEQILSPEQYDKLKEVRGQMSKRMRKLVSQERGMSQRDQDAKQ